MLAWLLDPGGSHGLGDSFLQGFLNRVASIGSRAGIFRVSPDDVKGWNSLDVEVAREVQAMEDGRIDVLVVGRSDGFVCLIENKVDSEEHSGQLSRYLEAVEKVYPKHEKMPVFLTPGGARPVEKRDAERYVPIGYGVVAGLVSDVLESCGATVDTDVAVFLKQYERTLRRRIVGTPSDLDRLALQVYISHREAINRIIEAKEVLNVTTWVIDPAVDRYRPEDLLPDQHGNKHRRFYSKSLDAIDALKVGRNWTSSKRIALFEFMYVEENHLTLTLMIGPGDQRTRERLWELGKREGFENSWNHERQMKGKRHFAIYVRPILEYQDFNPFDYEEAVRKIEMAVAEFFKQDYWAIVKAIQEEFRQGE